MLQFSTQTRIPALLKISLHVALVLPLVLAMAACGGGRPQQPHDDSQVWRPDTRLLLRYDTNHDGTVSRGEMEAGLKADFARIDENHNACLSPDEVSAENARRWQQDASAASKSWRDLFAQSFSIDNSAPFYRHDFVLGDIGNRKQTKSVDFTPADFGFRRKVGNSHH